jgi:hypothetical protein
MKNYDYDRIAKAHRLSTWSILLYFSFCLVVLPLSGSIMIRENENILIFLLLAILCFSIVCMVRLARAIQYSVLAIVLFVICLPFLVFGLIPLVAVYFYAGWILKSKAEVDIRHDENWQRYVVPQDTSTPSDQT